jgi:hypothetical protein
MKSLFTSGMILTSNKILSPLVNGLKKRLGQLNIKARDRKLWARPRCKFCFRIGYDYKCRQLQYVVYFLIFLIELYD